MAFHLNLSKASPEVCLEMVCPRCKGALNEVEDGLECKDSCGAGPFPVREGRPILIDDESGLFARSDFCKASEKKEPSRPDFLTRYVNRLPGPSLNLAPPQNLRWLMEPSLGKPEKVIVVVGCGDGGANLEPLYAAAKETGSFRLLELDVSWDSRAHAIADGHDLPLPDNSVDAVVCQAVLEHVLDSERVVDEIWRILRPGGRVLAEIPFLQPTHNYPYDFRRFTMAGQRVLFRGFDCVRIGTALGAGSASARIFETFLIGLFPPRARWIVVSRTLAAVVCSWWKQLDRLRRQPPASKDASSGIYFLGTKREAPLTRKEAFLDFREKSHSPQPTLKFGNQ